MPKYQNLIFNGGAGGVLGASESDEELIKPMGVAAMSAGIDPFYRNGSVSPKFTSHHALCTNQVSFDRQNFQFFFFNEVLQIAGEE